MKKVAHFVGMVGLLAATVGAPCLGQVQTSSCCAALLVIDVQSGWLGPGAVTVDQVRVQDKIAEILDVARPSGIPILFIVDVSTRAVHSEYYLALADPLEVLEGDLLIEKQHPNAFTQTTLDERLRAMGISTLIVTGFASDACVRATVNGARYKHYDIIIVEDGHSGGDGGQTAARQNDAWREMDLVVMPSAEIDSAALCSTREDAE